MITPHEPAAPLGTTRNNRLTGWRRQFAILKVMSRKLLITPMLRGRQDPAYYARASAIGFFLNFTPSVGFQIPLVVTLWTLTRTWSPRWDFHLGLASAWTLLTSLPTVPPMYYTFIVTGRLMLGRWEEMDSFARFAETLQGLPTATSWWASLWSGLVQLWDLFGLPLFLGSLPWGLGMAWISYLWTLRLIHRHRLKQPPLPG